MPRDVLRQVQDEVRTCGRERDLAGGCGGRDLDVGTGHDAGRRKPCEQLDIGLQGLTKSLEDDGDGGRAGERAQLREAVLAAATDADAVVMAAAPADFRPAAVSEAKIKKAADVSVAPLDLVQNPDILAELARTRPRPDQVVVGFAAETGDADGTVLDHARAKLTRKGCDLLVVNDVGGGKVFGQADNEAVVLAADGGVVQVPHGPKAALAHVIWDQVTARLSSPAAAAPHGSPSSG